MSLILTAPSKARDYDPPFAVQESGIQDRAQGHTANEGQRWNSNLSLSKPLMSNCILMPQRVPRAFSLGIKASAPGIWIFSSLRDYIGQEVGCGDTGGSEVAQSGG